MRLRKEARTETLGFLSHGRFPHSYQFHALCLRQREQGRRPERHSRGVRSPGEGSIMMTGDRPDTECLTGQRRAKSSFETCPPPWRGLSVVRPRTPGAGSSVSILFGMPVREAHSHCGRDATVAAAWLLEP